jgi:hypothetical protein
VYEKVKRTIGETFTNGDYDKNLPNSKGENEESFEIVASAAKVCNFKIIPFFKFWEDCGFAAIKEDNSLDDRESEEIASMTCN